MASLIVVGVVVVLVAAAVRYIWKERKKGAGCIGCSSGGCCSCKGCEKEREN